MATRAAWVLNLDAEYELADPRGYTPSRVTLERMRDQAARIEGLVRPGDVRLALDAAPGAARGAGVAGALQGKLWCPTPRALACLRAAGASLPDHPPLEVVQRVNHRRFAAERLPGPLGSVYVASPDAALELLSRPSPSGRWVAKRAFGLAGRGHRRFGGAPDELDGHWIRSSFKLGHGLLVEPWVEREADFGIHGLVARNGELALGRPLLQVCDAHGMWQRSALLPASGLDDQELEALRAAGRSAGEALHHAGYHGPFGVDAFRYRDVDGARGFNPHVEINARYCMGWGLSGLPS